MTDRAASRRGASAIAPLLMVLSFLAMGGLLFWLNATAEGTQPVVMEEPEEPMEDPAEAGAVDVTTDQIRQAPDGLVDQLIRVSDVAVLQPVGSEAFFMETGVGGEQSAPFLAKLGSDLLAQGQGIPTGNITVVGTLKTVNDSIVEAWSSAGAIGAGDRALVEFSSHFLEIVTLRSNDAGSEPAN